MIQAAKLQPGEALRLEFRAQKRAHLARSGIAEAIKNASLEDSITVRQVDIFSVYVVRLPEVNGAG